MKDQLVEINPKLCLDNFTHLTLVWMNVTPRPELERVSRAVGQQATKGHMAFVAFPLISTKQKRIRAQSQKIRNEQTSDVVIHSYRDP